MIDFMLWYSLHVKFTWCMFKRMLNSLSLCVASMMHCLYIVVNNVPNNLFAMIYNTTNGILFLMYSLLGQSLANLICIMQCCIFSFFFHLCCGLLFRYCAKYHCMTWSSSLIKLPYLCIYAHHRKLECKT